jgi:hypothetical protein
VKDFGAGVIVIVIVIVVKGGKQSQLPSFDFDWDWEFDNMNYTNTGIKGKLKYILISSALKLFNFLYSTPFLQKRIQPKLHKVLN